MTVKYFALLTNLGAAKLANAAALDTQLQITQMAVGDGGGVLPTPNPAQTQLLGEKRRAALNSLSIDEANSSQIIAEQVIPETDGGWWIREVGLFDKDGILIAIANCPDTYKPQLQEGSGRTQTVRMVLIVSSTEAVTLKIDPSVVLATRQYVDKKVDDKVIEVKQYADKLISEHEKSRNHPDASLTAKGFAKYSSAIDSNSEALAATPKAVKTAVEAAAKDLGDHGKAVNPHNQYLQVANLLSEIKAKGPAALAETLANLGLSDIEAKAAGALQKKSNLSDVVDKSLARSALGLGSSATTGVNTINTGAVGWFRDTATGFIIQWGTTYIPVNAKVNVTFPAVFSGLRSITVSPHNVPNNAATMLPAVADMTNASFSLSNQFINNAVAGNYYWTAVGVI